MDKYFKGLLRAVAFDLPVYREVFARTLGSLVAWYSGQDQHSREALLRALTMKSAQSGALFIGRDVLITPRSSVHLGEGTILYGRSVLHAGRNGSISIGDGTHIDFYSVLYGQGGLNIGKRCAIAAGVIIYTQSNQYQAEPGVPVLDQPVKYAQVDVGDDVWIGARATILPGVTVASHAVIGAGAVVTRNVSAGSVVAGVPAREIGRTS